MKAGSTVAKRKKTTAAPTMNYKARAERAERTLANLATLTAEIPTQSSQPETPSDDDASRPEISAAHRAQLALLGALQVSDLFDSLTEIDTNIDGYKTVVAANAARGAR